MDHQCRGLTRLLEEDGVEGEGVAQVGEAKWEGVPGLWYFWHSVVIVKYDGLNDTLGVCSSFVSCVTYFPVPSIFDHACVCNNAGLKVRQREPRCASTNE